MLLLAILIGISVGSLLFRRTGLLEGNAQAAEPAVKRVRAFVDGKPVSSYVADE